MVSVGISSLGRTQLIFIDPIDKINGSYYRNTLLRHIFCQPFVQYLDLHVSSRFNKTMPRLTMLTRLVALLLDDTPDFIRPQTGHQTALISIRLTTWSGAFCKSECTAARFVTSTIWKNGCFTIGAAWFSLSLTEQSASGNSVCITVSAWKADILTIILKHCHCKTENKLLWVVVQSCFYMILFRVWFLSKAKMNFPETSRYCLQYIVFIKLCLIR